MRVESKFYWIAKIKTLYPSILTGWDILQYSRYDEYNEMYNDFSLIIQFSFIIPTFSIRITIPYKRK